MSLKGNLQSVDLANVLQMLSINQKEGTLVLFDGDTRKSIYFSHDGVSMLSRGRKGQDSLGRILLRYGKISDAALAEALSKQKAEDKRLGEVLEQMGLVTATDIDDAIRTQIEEEIYNLFIWKEASFEFIEGPPPPGPENAPTRVTFNVNSLIMEAQRRADEWNYIRGLVPSLDEIYRPTEKMPEAVVTDEVFHFPFAPRVLEQLQVGRLNVSELIEASHAAKFEACKILAILLEQGAIEPVTMADLTSFAQESSTKGDHKQAAKFLSRVVDLGGATSPVNMSLGYALEAMDEPERASIYFRAAGESYVEAMEPKNAFDAYQRIARALPTDLPAVTQMVEIACNNPDILAPNRHEVTEAGRTLALCLKELGRLPAAIQILNSLSQSSKEDMPLRSLLVQAYQDSAMLNEAMTELEAMADYCTDQKNFDEAIRFLRRIVGIDRNRPGVLKKIEGLTRSRDSGKRLMLRVVAAGCAVVVVAAAVWAFGAQRQRAKTKEGELESKISAQLDPLVTKFNDAEALLWKFRNALDGYKGASAESVKSDVDNMDAAMKTMEDTLSATQSAAAALFQGNESMLPRDFVDSRTRKFKAEIERVHQARGTITATISEGSKDDFVTLRTEKMEKYPLGCIKAVERIKGLLSAVKATMDVTVNDKIENVEQVLSKLHEYEGHLKKVQKDADALWKAGRYRDSHSMIAEFLGPLYTTIEFAEILKFKVRVTTVPAGAIVRPRDGSVPGGPAPQDLPYAAGSGLVYEVSAPGFKSVSIEIPPIKGAFSTAMLLERFPWEQRVVLTKVPLWTTQLGSTGIEAIPVTTADGAHLVVADRNGIIHLVEVKTGKSLKSADCRSVSGFRSSPLVTADSIYAATADGVVAALDFPSLNVRWRKEGDDGPGPANGTPVLAEGLLVVAGAATGDGNGGKMMAFDPKTGEKKWEIVLEAGTVQPLLFARGWIVATGEDGRVRAVSTDGKGVITVLPSARDESGYSPPRSRTLAVGERVLLGLEGSGQEFSLVELPVPGAQSPHVGYKWGAKSEGAEVSGACLAGDVVYLLFSNGIARRVSTRIGPRPGDLQNRVLPEKEAPVKEPAFQDGRLFVASSKGLTALKPGEAEFREEWRWLPEGAVITTSPVAVGNLVVVGSKDGRLFALLRD
jgi:outer membrane protein assembly factor BamB/tetratricopeptide (TPR) repeat protein